MKMVSRDSSYILPKGRVKAPPGGIVINDKWLGSILGNALKNNSSSVYFTDGLGLIDFFISEASPVVYLPHAELIDSSLCQSKLLRMLGAYPNLSLTVIAERNWTTVDLYNSMWEFVTVDLDSRITLVPFGNLSELPMLLLNMAKAETESSLVNPFLGSKKIDLGATQMAMINKIPGVGEKKARLLLENFGSLLNIANASEAQLSLVVTDKAAKTISSFFRR